ncbi:DUF4870 domain-containing protein [Demequina globuliformis]|uniref:DUF4870 domain-containing protein n=1 Tax=Demequina globuliformis TaxID=676202 RepID=UPI0007849C86|nr:DUF4870 domain-containing protein [Demequina globuliformis]
MSTSTPEPDDATEQSAGASDTPDSGANHEAETTPEAGAVHEAAFAADAQDPRDPAQTDPAQTNPVQPEQAADGQTDNPDPQPGQSQYGQSQYGHAQYGQSNGHYPHGAPAPMLESDARMWAMFTHVGALIAAAISASVLGFAVPLVIWLIYRERSALVAHHGRQQLNLQLTALCVGLGAVIIGLATLLFGFIVTLPLFIAYWIYSIVVSIIAAVKANNGDYYRIKLVIPFFK